jgi:hypothetical protein
MKKSGACSLVELVPGDDIECVVEQCAAVRLAAGFGASGIDIQISPVKSDCASLI